MLLEKACKEEADKSDEQSIYFYIHCKLPLANELISIIIENYEILSTS